jgi:hypothetical protein
MLPLYYSTVVTSVPNVLLVKEDDIDDRKTKVTNQIRGLQY